MIIKEIFTEKRQFLALLLLGDEQEEMIDRYLDDGRMFVLTASDKVIGECVVQDIGNSTVEIKNIAVKPEYQRKGYGRMLIEFLESTFKQTHSYLLAGTGDSPLTIPFYERSGFIRSHIIKNFFVDNYDHEIIEGGVKIIDMVYLRKTINPD